MSKPLEQASAVVLGCCALVVTLLLVRRELFTDPAQAPAPTPVLHEADWEELGRRGVTVGDSTAPVQVVVFSDYACPFCFQLDRDLTALREEEPGAIRVVFRHYPNSDLHPGAKLAALGAECAADLGRFSRLHTLLFEHFNADREGSVRARPELVQMSVRAGVVDTGQFSRCLDSPRAAEAVLRDSAEAVERRISGTPLVFVNARRIDGAVPPDALRRILREERQSNAAK
ncbi:MAG: thioredoxin domain-containing protein [Gemmatimonadales bacterium]